MVKQITIFVYFLCALFSANAHAAQKKDDQILLKSTMLGEDRVINISLPKHYEYANKSYPVLYVLDGEWAFDYAKGAVEFLSGDIVGFIPDMIIVGVPNTVRARDLFVTRQEGDTSEIFRQFLELELKKHIDKTYRTNGFDIIYGWSSASGISIESLYKRPDLFDGHIITGTGIREQSYAYGLSKLKNNAYKNVYLYANAESGTSRAQAVLRFGQLLDEASADGLQWKAEVLENTEHLDVISKGLYAGLEFVFSSFRIPDTAIESGADGVRDHFDGLSTAYEFEIEIPVGAVTEAASLLYQADKLDEAISIVNHGITIHPHAADLHSTLAELYEINDQAGEAIKQYRAAAKIAKKQKDLAGQYRYEALAQGLKASD